MPPNLKTALAALAVLLLNLFVVWPLFSIEYSAHLNTNEGTFIAIARVMAEHPGERLWWPFWDCGLPFQNTYLPLLHESVALAIRWLDLTPARAFHGVSALVYSLGPVALFFLVRVVSRSLMAGLLAGTLYSLVSPSAILSPAIRHDVGGLWDLRRLSVLVSYGEGPPTMGLLFLPLSILFSYLLLRRRSPVYAILAGLSLAGGVLSNAFAGTCSAIAVACLLLTVESGLLSMLAVGALSYAAISPWLPPSVLAAIRMNSPTVDGDYRYTTQTWIALAATLIVLAALWWLLRRFQACDGTRFFSLYAFLLAAIALLGLEGRIYLLPQAHRYQIAMDMMLCALASIAIAALFNRAPSRVKVAIAVILAAGFARQTVHCAKYARRLIQPIDIAQTVEYKTAAWMDRNLPGRRAMVAGSVSFLYNVFTDNPQLHGGHDPMLPNFLMRAVVFSIFSDMNAGDRAAQYSLTWLKALGAHAITVPGPTGREFYKPYAHPAKFDGLLPVLWREGGDTIYGVPQRSTSLAHVIPAAAVVARTPIHGLDIEPVTPFVKALDDPALPLAEFNWRNLHSAHIKAELKPGQVVSVQVTHAPGWRATARGAPLPVRADGLGMIVIEPQSSGSWEIDLEYDGGAESKWTRALSLASLLIASALAYNSRTRRVASST